MLPDSATRAPDNKHAKPLPKAGAVCPLEPDRPPLDPHSRLDDFIRLLT